MAHGFLEKVLETV